MKKRIILFLCIFLIFGSCKNKKENLNIEEDKFKKFNLKQFSKNYSFTLEGESAEISGEKNTKIISPFFSLQTTSEIIEIKTDKEGRGEIKVEPETKRIKEIIITGKVNILYKNREKGKINMEIICGKVTYIDEKKEIVFEEKPVIKRDSNIFSGDKIFYNIENNTIEIKGNVNVEIILEENITK